ncbi:MAG: hypothetical protein MK080_13820 [Opitutales bacterium]|nr:hypothetical protein [Opitutales bacterium]NRA28035.1 hypothetical protein [Opitutales bacterium]
MGFFLSNEDEEAESSEVLTDADRVELVKAVLASDDEKSKRAICSLVQFREIAVLYEIMKSPSAKAAALAEGGIWEIWHSAHGEEIQKQIERGMRYLASGKASDALEVFQGLMHTYTDWAEPMYKAATVLYFCGKLDGCYRMNKKVVSIDPLHFGAWHGMAMSALQLGRAEEAKDAIEHALAIQPHSPCREDLLSFLETIAD